MPAHERQQLEPRVTDEALEEILRDSGLQLLPLVSGQLVVVKARAQGGTVSGRVTDAKTNKPIPNVAVFLEGTRWRTSTGEDGAYHLTDVAAASYTLTASRIGYTKQTRSVTVAAGQEVTVDVSLSPAATALEQVVVTGTVVPTEVRALPTPVSVITESDVALQRPHTVQELFRQAVPTGVSWDFAAYPYNFTVSARGTSSLSGLGQMKVFLDR